MSRIGVLEQFVRGEVPLRAVSWAGVEILIEGERISAENPARIFCEPSAQDVARGFVRHQAKHEDLAKWAQVLLAGSSFIDLGRIEKDANGDLLLEGLWDASFGEPVSENVLELVRRLANDREES